MQRHRYDRANFSAASRPWDKGGGGHPDPEICRGAVSKTFFSALWASVWSKNEEGPGPLPWIRRWIWLTEEIKTLSMFTLSVQAQYSSTMLAESTRGYLSVNTPVLCIQSRSEFRCGASTRSRPCTTTTARFSVGTDVNSTACMRTSLVSKYVSVYWQSIFFLSAKWSNCVHYIWTISDIRFWQKRNFVTFVPVLWQLCSDIAPSVKQASQCAITETWSIIYIVRMITWSILFAVG